MHPDQLTAMCDQQAATYDRQWSKLSVSGDGLHLLIASIFAELPIRSRVLCVGAGTGAETIYPARRFPQSTFTVVEPSTQLLEACRHGAAEHGVTDHFHERARIDRRLERRRVDDKPLAR